MLKASSSARGRSRAVCSAASMVSYLIMSGTQVSSEQEDMRDHGAYWSAQGAHILSAVAGVSLYVMLKFSASASRNHKLVCAAIGAQNAACLVQRKKPKTGVRANGKGTHRRAAEEVEVCRERAPRVARLHRL